MQRWIRMGIAWINHVALDGEIALANIVGQSICTERHFSNLHIATDYCDINQRNTNTNAISDQFLDSY